MKKDNGTFIFRINRKTLNAMVSMYCRDHHHTRDLCSECSEVYEYALEKLEKCPFGDKKPPCTKCSVHCYSHGMRERIREIMRYSGPRMMLRHPVLTLFYLVNKRRFSGTA